MSDNLGTASGGIDAPATFARAITPHDTNPLTRFTRALYVGTGGNAVVRFVNDANSVTLTGLVAGQVYPFRLSHVLASGTTAGSLVGLD